jgi:uncharacterized membrane protein
MHKENDMLKKNAMMALTTAALLMLSINNAIAQCGDSVCGYRQGTYTCYVVTSTGDIDECTAENPCRIRCP